MEVVTRELAQHLSTLGLASAADLRRCAARVRKLARGLPVTDSVWIDALVLSGKLSQFQARALESDRAAELVVGRKFVFRRPVHLDPLLSVYDAHIPGHRDRFLISRMACLPGNEDATVLRLLKTVKSLSGLRNQFPSLPIEALLERGEIFLVTPHLPGESLSRLLVRRGRFPENIVRAIAQETLRQLQATESFCRHGDLRPANLWLTTRGEIGLLNWGLLDAVSPEINIHSRLPLDVYDGLAPERMEAQKSSTTASDLYALGCLFWQLLTGRPPFTVADPLAKLTAHRTRNVPDVRTLAPDVSESLALLIRSMTSREIHRRPQSAAEIRQILGPAPLGNKRRLQGFIEQFESAAPRQTSPTSVRSRIPALAGMVVLTLGMVALAWNREHLGWPALARVSAASSESLLNWMKREQLKPDSFVMHDPHSQPTETLGQEELAMPDSSRERAFNTPTLNDSITSKMTAQMAVQHRPAEFPSEPRTQHVPRVSPSLLQPLPSPTLTGVLHLGGDQPYAASRVVTGETLVLQGTAEQPATIRIHDTPLILEADQIQLEHVRILVDQQAALQGESPIQLRARTLSIHQSVVDWRSEAPSALATAARAPNLPVRKSALLHWRAPSEMASATARMLVQESLLMTDGAVFYLEIPLAAAQFENIFARHQTSLLELARGAGVGLRAPVILNTCTLRESGPVVMLPAHRILEPSGLVSLQGTDSLIDLQRGRPVFGFLRPLQGSDWLSHVEVAARGLVVEVGTSLAGVIDGHGSRFRELASDEMRVDGLLSGDFHFVEKTSAESGSPPADEQIVIDALPVRFSNRTPGAETNRLPRLK